MESNETINIDLVEEAVISKNSAPLNYPKNFQGVVETAKHYIRAGNSIKDIANCIFDELEGADKAVILKALEEGCSLGQVHANIYYHNILKIQQHASNTNQYIFSAES